MKHDKNATLRQRWLFDPINMGRSLRPNRGVDGPHGDGAFRQRPKSGLDDIWDDPVPCDDLRQAVCYRIQVCRSHRPSRSGAHPTTGRSMHLSSVMVSAGTLTPPSLARCSLLERTGAWCCRRHSDADGRDGHPSLIVESATNLHSMEHLQCIADINSQHPTKSHTAKL